MKVLLAIDIVHPFKPVAEQLLTLIPKAGIELKLLYVREELPNYEAFVETAGDFQEDWKHVLEKKAHEVLSQAEEYFKPHVASVSSEIVDGPPAYMIETVARDHKVDVIALAAKHHPKVQLFLLGSVSSSVVQHAPKSVIVLHADGRPKGKVSKVVVAVDGSAQSKHAVKNAAKQFAIKDADVTVVHVVSVPDVLKMFSPVAYISFVENNLLLEGETFVANAKEQLTEDGVSNISCELKEGDPATEILKLAKSKQADLIITGAKGHSAIQHFFLGSVAHRVATGADCACAVITADHS